MATRIFLVLLCLVILATCTVDLNIHQLQMVADHLEMKECKKLVNALRQNSFELVKETDETEKSHKPCIALLLNWDRTDGDGKSFDDLAFRLGQIGRKDLSEKLSKAVYEVKADELDKLFLNDPFRNYFPDDSLILDGKTKGRSRDKLVKEKNNDFSGWEIASIVFGGIVAVSVVCYLIYYLVGDAFANAFRKYAPKYLVKWVDMVSSECSWLCKKTKRKYYTEVVGSHSIGFSSQKSLTEMNRNLNCYLNGNSLEALYCFDELIAKCKRSK